MANITKPHVAILVSPGVGHLIPTLELAKRLIFHHHFTATLFVATIEKTVTPLLDSSLPPSDLLRIINLPINIPSSTSSSNLLTHFCSMMRSILSPLHSAISQSPSPPTTLIVDIFGTEAFRVADEFNMKKYVFSTSNAWFLAHILYLPTLDKGIKPNEELKIPSCKPIRSEDLPDVGLKWGEPDYVEWVRLGSEMARAHGILVNTWEDLERDTICAFRTNESFCKTPVHPIGPVTRATQLDSEDRNKLNEVFTWLDEQPRESVIYVSFGSGGTLSATQTVELAYGLELSQQRFVWVIRVPREEEIEGSMLRSTNTPNEDDVSRFVPDGFLDRTQNVGKVVLKWAPQVEILAHSALGGFLTHCGWNSTLESLTNGVPLIAWPLYAEQNMNATLLCEEIKVAVRSNALPTKEIIGREEIERLVRKIMVDDHDEQGFSYKEMAKELRRSAQEALCEGGSSFNSLAQVARECELHALNL